MKAATQEATETSATTKTEAAKGDQAAIRKLAKQQAAAEAISSPAEESNEQQPDKASADGTGRVLKAQA